MRTIRFLKAVAPYNPGEIAGFDDRIAVRHVDSGAAEYFVAEAGEAAGPVVIPDGWRDLKPEEIIALARTLGAPKSAKTVVAATAFIEAEVSTRSAAAAAVPAV